MTDYSLKPVKKSEVPTRGELKATAVQILNDFYKTEEKYAEILNKGKAFTSKKELMRLYDALKAVIKKNKLTVEAKTEKGRLFLVREP